MSEEFNHNPQRAIEAAVEAAEQKRLRGDLHGAYEDYQAILKQRIGSEYIAADLSVLQSLADLAMLFSNFQAADDLLTGLSRICQDHDNWHRADYATLKRIHLALDRGLFRQARDLFKEMAPRIGSLSSIQISPDGLQRWEARCHWANTNTVDRTEIFSQLYLEVGRLQTTNGQYRDALEILNRGLTHATPSDSQKASALARRLVPWFQLAIARALLESGMLLESEAVLDTLRIFLGNPQERSLQIQWYTLAGKLALMQGSFGAATQHFREILVLCQQLKSQRGSAIASLNLAQVLIILNQTQLADNHLAVISADIEQLNDAHLSARLTLLQKLTQARSQSLVAGSTLSISDLLQANSPQNINLQSNDNVTSEVDFARTQSPNYLTFFEDRALEFQWHLSQFDLNAASQLLSLMQDVFDSTDSKLIGIKIKVLQGILSYYWGVHYLQSGNQESAKQQFRWATLTLDETRPQLAIMGLLPERWQVQRVLGWCLKRLNAPEHDQEILATETTQLLDKLTRSLSPKEQVIFLLNKWTADEEYIATQIAQLQQMKNRIRSAPLYQKPQIWWQLLQRLSYLMSHIDHYKDVLAKRTILGVSVDLVAGKTPSLWMRLVKHPRQRATLVFLVLPELIFVIRNWRFGLDFSIIPTTRLELHNLVEQWYKPLDAKQNNRGLSTEPGLIELAEINEETHLISRKIELISDELGRIVSHKLAEKLNLSLLLETLPKKINRLTIVPDSILHIVPFSAIKYQEKYLIETFALTITYQSFGSSRSIYSTQNKNQALLVGISQPGNHFASLPGVINELDKVCIVLKQQQLITKMIRDEEARKKVILDRLETASLLHIACHGTFHHKCPEQSGLVFDPSQSPPEVLSLQEISRLNLGHLKHVTLSACSSADHLILPGRWVVSLPETLWRSGAHSILGSLWEVYDQVAIAFMERFYTYLQTLPRDEAIRQTQLDCLYCRIATNSISSTSNPIFWAGFNLYGEHKCLFQPKTWAIRSKPDQSR